MVEPAASIIALVATGTKVCLCLNDIVGTMRDAPQSAQSVRNELFAVNAALCQIQSLYSDPKSVPSKNAQQDIKVMVRSCKDTFQELEAVVHDYKPGVWSRLTWLTKEKEVMQLLRRLESHKASLNLIITVVGG
jgi:N-terminal domain on NACHT_NTPase and P-loop NTPases